LSSTPPISLSDWPAFQPPELASALLSAAVEPLTLAPPHGRCTTSPVSHRPVETTSDTCQAGRRRGVFTPTSRVYTCQAWSAWDSSY